MCFPINIWNLLTFSALLMCSGKLFHNLVPWYVREFRPWVVVLHFGCMMILLALRLYGNFFLWRAYVYCICKTSIKEYSTYKLYHLCSSVCDAQVIVLIV